MIRNKFRFVPKVRRFFSGVEHNAVFAESCTIVMHYRYGMGRRRPTGHTRCRQLREQPVSKTSSGRSDNYKMKNAMEPLRPDRIIRSRRRTISLEITREAALVVRAPLRTTDAHIGNLIREKRAWIEKKMAEMRSRPPAKDTSSGARNFYFSENSTRLRFLPEAMPGSAWAIGSTLVKNACRSAADFSGRGTRKKLPGSCLPGSPGLPPFSTTGQKRSGSRIPGGAGPRAARQVPSPSVGALSLPHQK